MYDPIEDATIPSEFYTPDNYWTKEAGLDPQSPYPALKNNIEIDVAIIGGGFTGLSTAYHLANDFGRECAVIEANQPGWGCSGRNGGFVLPGTGRLGVQQLTKKWGLGTAKAIYADYLASIENVKTIIDSGIKCNVIKGGYLKIAHTPDDNDSIQQQARLLNKEFGDAIVPLNAGQISEQYINGPDCFGGIFYPDAFAVNPYLLCTGLAQRAKNAGADIFGNSAVLAIHKQDEGHIVHTSNGIIRCKHLILASNAYGQRRLHSALHDRVFPVASSILVTQPLTKEQLQEVRIKAGLMVMDTRALKYYYRLLPDNRLLFGGRGAIKGKNVDKPKARQHLLNGLHETFKTLTELKADFFWSGWVGVSLDDYPRIYRDIDNNVSYSSGYCGAGLAFSIHAGKFLAQQLCAPNTLPNLPYFSSALQKFPFANFRRVGLQAFYTWQNIAS